MEWSPGEDEGVNASVVNFPVFKVDGEPVEVVEAPGSEGSSRVLAVLEEGSNLMVVGCVEAKPTMENNEAATS